MLRIWIKRSWRTWLVMAVLGSVAGVGSQTLSAQGPPDQGPPPDVTVGGLLTEYAKPHFSAMPTPKNWHLETRFGGKNGPAAQIVKRGRKIEYSLVKFEGPGALVRLWISDASGHLMLYLDGAANPSLKVDLKLLRSGQFQVFSPPFSEPQGDGVVLRFPIPFTKSLEIRCENPPPHWVAESRHYEASATVHPFDAKSAAAQAFFMVREEVESLWALTKPLPTVSAAEMGSSHPAADANFGLAAGANKVAFEASDGGLLEEISFEHFLPFLSPAQLTGLWLKVEADGKARASVPMMDFFAESLEFRAGNERWTRRALLYDGICRRRTARWPMPFRKTLKIIIENRGDEEVPSMRFFFKLAAQKPEGLSHYFKAESFERRLAFGEATSPLVLVPHFAANGRILADILRTPLGAWDRGGVRITNKDPAAARSLAADMATYSATGTWRGAAAKESGFGIQRAQDKNETMLMRQRLGDLLSVQRGDRLSIDVGWDGQATRIFRGSVFYFEKAGD